MLSRLLLAALASAALFGSVSAVDEAQAAQLFEQFKSDHGKHYASRVEESRRFAIFKQNLAHIEDLNARGSSATFGVTSFADLSREEFRRYYLSSTPAVRPEDAPVAPEYDASVVGDLPSSFDWRDAGAVTPVKNQGQCGSCWSFSTTGNVEGQWFLAKNPLVGLSEQNLVDCDHECMIYEGQKSCDQGCNGGLQPNAFEYIIKNGGIDTESSYPYTAVDGSCKFKSSSIGAKISNWTFVSSDEDQMAAYLVANGPLAIAADAAEWQFYTGGVFDLPCGKQLDHGILIVGYGSQFTILGKKDYWTVKNSWGASWGEQGYLKIVRGVGECGLNTFVSSAII